MRCAVTFFAPAGNPADCAGAVLLSATCVSVGGGRIWADG
jgi:hypothetical protein